MISDNVVCTCVLLCVGSLHETISVQIKTKESDLCPSGPGGATFCRSRYLLDAVLMQSRRNFWRSNGWGKHWIALGPLPTSMLTVKTSNP